MAERDVAATMGRMMSGGLTQLVANAKNRFQQRFGRSPRWVVAAPGRVNIIGEHVDYNDGFVLPMGIDRYCVLAAGEFDESNDGQQSARIYSAATDEEAVISLDRPQRNSMPSHWANYFAGVIAGCTARNFRPAGFVAVAESSVPVGGGLSSSAAIEVATATLLEAMTQTELEPIEKALICQQAEHTFAGVPCGIMDQFASTLCRADHLMLLDCRSQKIEHIPLTDPNITVLIINTNVKHELSGGEYAERRGQCESAARKLGVSSLRDVAVDQLDANRSNLDATEYCRAHHVVTEIARTVEAAASVKSGDWRSVGRLMYASHGSLRDDFEVSCDELDLLVEIASQIGSQGGVIGSRMTGGGFGGCTVSLVETAHADMIARSIAASYREKTGIEPTVIMSRPARGAHIVRNT
ncbi:MAG TPA: galactokinase [Lacipirellulaceae bacterium]|nr:galactokinase [Lacipirellulaceae bacterium]